MMTKPSTKEFKFAVRLTILGNLSCNFDFHAHFFHIHIIHILITFECPGRFHPFRQVNYLLDSSPLRDPVVESMQARKPGLQALSSLAGSKTKITKLFGRLNVS